MIIIKSEDEITLLSKLEGALKGEEIEMYTSDEDITIEEIAASIAYNVQRSRTYTGRLVGHTQKQQEALREQNRLLTPISQYFEYKLAKELELTPMAAQGMTVRQKLTRQKEVARKLEEEGKAPDTQ